MIHEHIELNNSEITLGVDCLSEALADLRQNPYSAIFLISQQMIWDLHGDKVSAALEGVSPKPRLRLVDDGEQVKNLNSYGELLHWLAEERADRKSLILVLGGGVVGDLSGFVAASYMRGMDWMYIPTTLLSQQDASVGGKVAVNLPHGKNLVGVFWDPKHVIIDASVLHTLPTREVNAGYMEMIKHGMLRDEDLFQRIARLPADVSDWSQHLPLLADGLRVKVDVVREDPFEKDKRRLLNLGHTMGHALESFTNYKSFLHGEAVGIGLVYASILSRKLGGDYDFTALTNSLQA